MKQSVVVILLAVWALQSGFGQAPAAPAAASNAPSLLSNGDFETDQNGDGQPDGWLKAASSNVWCETEGSNHFLRLQATEPGKMVMVYRAVPLAPEIKALELSFRVRYDGIKAGKEVWFDGRIMMNFKDADKKALKPGPPPPFFKGSSKEWKERSVKFLVTEGATSLELLPALFQAAAGTLDFDDFRLTPIPAEAVQAAAVSNAAERVAKARASVKRAPDAELIANGDFETDKNADGVPDGWFGKASDTVLAGVEGSNRYLRLVGVPGKMVMVYRAIPLATEDKAFELTFRVRHQAIKPGGKAWYDGRIMMNFKDAGKKVVPGAPTPYFRGTRAEWRTVTNRFRVPDQAVSLEFMPTLFQVAAGSIEFDDFHLRRLTEAEATVMIATSDAVAKKKDDQRALIEQDLAMPPVTPELKVDGKNLVTADGKTVWLQGLSVDSMQWGPGESVLWSVRTALNDWHANVIRLAVKEPYWFGDDKEPVAYRKTVDEAVKLCAGKGAWLLLDLHRFGAPMEAHRLFWKDAAARYKDNPAVLFELFNEPHGISWEIWRNGGNLKGPENKVTDVNPTENQETNATEVSTGMQALVDAVRSTGAKNIVLAGGLDWSYDITGVVNGFGLSDTNGNGIMYVSHIYPWKSDWAGKVLVAAAKFPVIITEVGCPPDYSGFQFIPPAGRHPLEGWSEDVIAMMQTNKLNWTGFSFHPRCGPMVISDWDYTPTPYWGVYVKEALAGKVFELKKMR